jgi:dihydroorotate dehydrogenase
LRRERGPVVVGVNIGKNRDVPIDAAIGNYVDCFKAAFDAADYIAVNVSSPNTPNLRELQRAENLEDLLRELRDANLRLAAERGVPPRPLLVKIAPDLEDPEVETIVGTAVNLGLAGLIATNTTVSREGLRTALNEAGGLSGKPLRKRSDAVVRLAYRTARGRLPIIGVGGIFSASDAFEKIAAGASLVQAYTGFVYGGPMFARDINAGLARILFERGFASLDDAVGSAAPNGRNV